MSNQVVKENLGGISRSGRVRKKSTKLMESLEVSKSNTKSDKVANKTSPSEKKMATICSISSPPSDHFPIKMEIKTFLDECNVEEELVTETVTTERLPLSAEGLPLAVPASGYYTYQGQFSHVLPKTEATTKIVKKKQPTKTPKDRASQQMSPVKLKADFLDLKIVKTEPGCSSETSVDDLSQKQEVQQSPPVKKKKTTKFKDIMAGADWDKLKKKKKKKKEKEKLAKAMKMNEVKPTPDLMNAENDDSNSGSVGLVIAEPAISLPPKKRKKCGSESKKSSGEPKQKSAEKRKAKKTKVIKPANEEMVMHFANDGTDVGVKLEQLAGGGTIDDSDVVPMASASVVSSQYLTEKKKARRTKEKFVVGADGVVTQKKRRLRPITAYMLWCKENRPRIVAEDPSRSKDFAAISRRMGEVWQTLSDKEKMLFRRRAKRIGRRGSMISTGKKGSNKQVQQAAGKCVQGAKRAVAAEIASSKNHSSSSDLVPIYKVTGCEPIDVAAHMKLLGESLTIIGQRLTENEGQIAVSGSLSVLLDSTLCALGPLMCLTNQIAEVDGIDLQTHSSCLDSIAYVMPGL